LKVFCTDTFPLPLPEGHRFPIDKYALLRRQVAAAEWAAAHELCVPHAATDAELTLAHDPRYVERVARGGLDAREQRRIGFPWSPEMVERSRRSAGATIEACRAALDDGVAVNLAGGTHHAFRASGEGFCVFNDSVVAARVLQAERRVERVVVIDCDVHQGNGTAALCTGDPTLYTFSIHGARNFPYRKEQSDLDLALDDGTGDDAYLDALERNLRRALDAAGAQLALYVSGADPWEGDRWGRLALSKRGLAERDRLVLESCRRRGLPVAVTMAGGYAPRVEDTVEIHCETVRAAAALG